MLSICFTRCEPSATCTMHYFVQKEFTYSWRLHEWQSPFGRHWYLICACSQNSLTSLSFFIGCHNFCLSFVEDYTFN